MSNDQTKLIEQIRQKLLGNNSSEELSMLQLKTDVMTTLAKMDGGDHDHSQGGEGHHHDHALAEFAWQMSMPKLNPDVQKEKI